MSTIEEPKKMFGIILENGSIEKIRPDEFLALQLIKLTEKIGEAVRYYDKRLPIEMVMDMGVMEWKAKRIFDDYPRFVAEVRRFKIMIQAHELVRLKKELIDMQVLICCMAEILGEMLGEEIDLMQGAKEKAGE